MPVPGYDPEDVDDALESRLGEEDIRERLTDEEWESYQHEEASLIDLLDESEINRMLDDAGDGDAGNGKDAGDGNGDEPNDNNGDEPGD